MIKKVLPWLLFLLGFCTLSMYQGMISCVCMVAGIIMLLEMIWPEKWDDDTCH